MNDNFIRLVLAGIAIVIFILLGVLAYMYWKDKMSKKQDEKKAEKKPAEKEEKKAESIFSFMQFDNIEDNMIVQDNGKRYLMVIECKGVNYDLLSSVEKTGIEQGFLQFLNTLKFDIQMYVQTRKVNLAQSIMRYQERLKIIERDMREEEIKYENMQREGNYTREEILKELKEVTKKRNLYEYSKDVIDNTAQMSEDSDLTTKEYYIIVPYYTEEITSVGDYDKREIGRMAFSELYTRAQALVSALSECDVRGKILNSQQLIELLFVAYNREQHDIYDFEEYLSKSGYDAFYSVAEDVLEKRIRALDEEIVRKANEKAVNAYRNASKRVLAQQRAIREREENMRDRIDSLANDIIEQERPVVGDYMVNKIKDEVVQMNKEEDAQNQQSKEDALEPDLSIVDAEPALEPPKKKRRPLTEEEKKRRRAILRRRKLLEERRAKSNARVSEE